ncbi:MAG: hypothetical protein ATN35_06600 [Epulopiscium sp. Nele67-Bin004]|nr:MAG: hypothetical protein ATN35_06600 [Epulopiscium sp. Nele67-Bin004]
MRKFAILLGLNLLLVACSSNNEPEITSEYHQSVNNQTMDTVEEPTAVEPPKKEVTTEEVTRFVQANLHSDYLGQHGELEYFTAETTDRLEDRYLQCVGYDVNTFINYTGQVDVSIEDRAELLDLFIEINRQAQFDVQLATQLEDALFEVVIQVKPLNVIELVTQQLEVEQEDIQDGDDNQGWTQTTINALRESINNMSYTDEVEVVVQVSYNEDTDNYSLSEQYYEIYRSILNYN